MQLSGLRVQLLVQLPFAFWSGINVDRACAERKVLDFR